MVPFPRSSRVLAAFLATATAAAVPAQQQPFCPPPIVGQPRPFPDLGPGNIAGAPVAEVGQLTLAPIQDGAFHVGLSLRLAGRIDWDVATATWGGPGQPVVLDPLLGPVNTPADEFHVTFSPDLLHAVWAGAQGIVHASRKSFDMPFAPPQPVQGLPPVSLPPAQLDPALALIDGRLALYLVDPASGGLSLFDLDVQGPLGGPQQVTVLGGRTALLPPPGIQQLHGPCPLLDAYGRCQHLVLCGERADGSSVGLYATNAEHGASGLGVVDLFAAGGRLEHPAAVCGDVYFPFSDGIAFQDPIHVPTFAMSSVGLDDRGGLAFPHILAPTARDGLLTALNLGVMTPPAGLGQNGLGLIDYGDACLLTVVAIPAPTPGCDALLGPMLVPPLPLGTHIDAQAIALDLIAGQILCSNNLRIGIDLPPPPCPNSALDVQHVVAEQLYPRLVGAPFLPLPIPPSVGPVQEIRFGAPIDSFDPFVPLRDYYATVCPSGGASMTFLRPGTYYAEVLTLAGQVREFMCCINSAPAEGGTTQPEARYVTIDNPDADVVSVESQVAGDNCFDDATAQAFWGESRHATVAEANTNIGNAYQNNGNRPVDVFLGGHGNTGVFTMGDGQSGGANTLRAADIGVAGTATQAFIAANRGKIGKLTLFGCSVARGAAGRAFLQALADAMSTPTQKATVCGYTQSVCAAKGALWGTLSVTEGAQRVSARGR